MNLLEKIRGDIEGVKALTDWLGDGSPVSEMVAEARSCRCIVGNDGNPCPLNRSPKWWEFAKTIASEWIRAELELKNHMKLRVQREDDLHMCAACGCCLPLKVWTPIEHIKNHLPKE